MLHWFQWVLISLFAFNACVNVLTQKSRAWTLSAVLINAALIIGVLRFWGRA
jgi:putative effector of murein hydrolase